MHEWLVVTVLSLFRGSNFHALTGFPVSPTLCTMFLDLAKPPRMSRVVALVQHFFPLLYRCST